MLKYIRNPRKYKNPKTQLSICSFNYQHFLVKKRIRKGVPNCFRGIVWRLLAKVKSKKKKYDKGYYQRQIKKMENTDIYEEIRLDLVRTFPKYSFY